MQVEYKNKLFSVLLLLGLMFVFPVNASVNRDMAGHRAVGHQHDKTPATPIVKFYREMRRMPSMKADFNQKVYDENGVLLQKSSGKMAWNHHRQFYWHIQRPNQQSLICDGQFIWIHTPSMHQVIKRQLRSQAVTPLALLSADLATMRQVVSVQLLSNSVRDGVVYALVPLRHDDGFSRIEMVFKRHVLRQIRMIDALQQLSEISFSNVEFAPKAKLKSSDFRFKQSSDPVSLN